MQRILSHQLAGHVGETVHVAGWIHRRRLLKSVAFLILRDAGGLARLQRTLTEAGGIASSGTLDLEEVEAANLRTVSLLIAVGTVIAQSLRAARAAGISKLPAQ